MTALIVVCIVISLMCSALWIVPPERERQRMALRVQARPLKLSVQLTSIELPDKWDKSTSRKKTVGYFYHRPKANKKISKSIWLLPYEVWKYRSVAQGWWCSDDINLSEVSKNKLERHAALLSGVKISSESVSFYWDEEGGEQDLNSLAELVFELAELNG